MESHPGNIREFVTSRMTDLLGLLKADTVRTRAELAKHTREIRMVPEVGANGQLFYMAEGGWNLLGGGRE